jgi:FixJ family two-component response regulator
MVVRALEIGAVGYVLKPVAKAQLSAMIEKAMAHTR